MNYVIGQVETEDAQIRFLGYEPTPGICMEVMTRHGPWSIRLTPLAIREMRMILREAQRCGVGGPDRRSAR